MGGVRKALLSLGGRTLLDHARDTLATQVNRIAVSANDLEVGAVAGALPVLADDHGDRRGPLAGLLAGMRWCRAVDPALRRVLTVPVDCPFLPRDLLERLHQTATESGAQVTIATSDDREHPAIGLWDLALEEPLRLVVTAGRDLSVRGFYRSFRTTTCAFSGRPDPLFNINTPEDLARAEDALRVSENLEAVIARDTDESHTCGLGFPHCEQRGR